MDRDIREYLKTVPDDYAEYHLKRTLRLMDETDIDCIQRMIKRFTSIIPKNLTDREKAALMYEVLTRRIHYVNDEEDADDETRFVFVSALIAGKGVCMGIAQLYTILCINMGITCKTVVGYAWNRSVEDGGLHAWNMVRLSENGTYRWYHCDPTWDLDEVHCPYRRFFLKSDGYMRDHRHMWLEERYPCCEQSAGGKTILNKKGVDLTCHILEEVIASGLAKRGSL